MVLYPERRREITKHAAEKRWAAHKKQLPSLPLSVTRLLKSYEVDTLDWNNPNDRYAIVREIIRSGALDARRWLGGMLSVDGVRAILKDFQGAGLNKPERALVRRRYRLTVADIPRRPFLGFG